MSSIKRGNSAGSPFTVKKQNGQDGYEITAPDSGGARMKYAGSEFLYVEPGNGRMHVYEKPRLAFGGPHLVTEDEAVGMGQTWQDVSASRAVDTAYQNTTGGPIQINFCITTGALGRLFQVSPDGIAWLDLMEFGTSGRNTGSPVIPDGWYYQFINGGTVNQWMELR